MRVIGKTLIVGCDSLIGRALYRGFQQAGVDISGTTRRREDVNEQKSFLDLGDKNLDEWKPQHDIKNAVICAGITNVGECEKAPSKTFDVNVLGVCGVVEKLVSAGIRVTYLSSNMVFDGNSKYPSVDASVSPVTEYGRQKAEVEKRILSLSGRVVVLRMTKILGGDYPLFRKWVMALKNGETIKPFSDMMFSPIPLKNAVLAIKLLSGSTATGIFHLSGDRDISYADAALMGVERVGLDTKLVAPVSCRDVGGFELYPVNTALNGDGLGREFDLFQPNVAETVRASFVDTAKCCEAS